MATRAQRNVTNLASIGLQYCIELGPNLRIEDIQMIHPLQNGFPQSYTDVLKLVTDKATENKYKVKSISVRDVRLQRNIVVSNELDYDILCNTERKQYQRMPVFTVIVVPEKGHIPPSPPVVKP